MKRTFSLSFGIIFDFSWDFAVPVDFCNFVYSDCSELFMNLSIFVYRVYMTFLRPLFPFYFVFCSRFSKKILFSNLNHGFGLWEPFQHWAENPDLAWWRQLNKGVGSSINLCQVSLHKQVCEVQKTCRVLHALTTVSVVKIWS